MKFPGTKRFNRIEVIFLLTGFLTLTGLTIFTVYSLSSVSADLFNAFSTDISKKFINPDLEGYEKLGL